MLNVVLSISFCICLRVIYIKVKKRSLFLPVFNQYNQTSVNRKLDILGHTESSDQFILTLKILLNKCKTHFEEKKLT